MMKFFSLIFLFSFILITDSLWLPFNQKAQEVVTKECPCRPVEDSIALLQLYNEANGKEWINKWDTSKPMNTWYGVKLNDSKCVRCLDLDGDPNCSWEKKGGNNLIGKLPELMLPHLEHLFLSNNKLSGPIVDFQFFGNLLTLELSFNQLTGNIPSFSKLRNLVFLDIDYNKLNGAIPNFLALEKLEILYLNNNQLTGQLPRFDNLRSLKQLYITNNQISNVIPNFKLPNLKKISLSNNQLTGKYPNFSEMKNLTYINLSNNELSGELSQKVKLKDLEYIDLSSNKFTGKIPSFSASKKLKTLVASNNNFSTCMNFKKQKLMQYLLLNGNALGFDDLIPNQKLLEEEHSYLGQRNSSKDSLIITTEGVPLTIQLPSQQSTRSNNYTWYKENVPLNNGINQNFLELSNNKQGKYYCRITNPAFPKLELVSPVFIVKTNLNSDEIDAILPEAITDEYVLSADIEKYTFNVVDNDNIGDLEDWNVQLLSNPDIGMVNYLGDGQFEYIFPQGFTGEVMLEYELCNSLNSQLCTEGVVSLKVTTSKKEQASFFVPNAISPNGDGVNDDFIIPILEKYPAKYPMNEVTIFNRYGYKVYHAAPYKNNWSGTLTGTGNNLPEGIYFYFVKLASEKGLIKKGYLVIKRE